MHAVGRITHWSLIILLDLTQSANLAFHLPYITSKYIIYTRSRQSSGGGVLEPLVTDDSILDLVESLQGDFPDCIAFDDPFDLFPSGSGGGGGATAVSPMTMQ